MKYKYIHDDNKLMTITQEWLKITKSIRLDVNTYNSTEAMRTISRELFKKKFSDKVTDKSLKSKFRPLFMRHRNKLEANLKLLLNKEIVI